MRKLIASEFITLDGIMENTGQNIVIHGSGDLINTLMTHNLIDEYHLMIHPIIVGGGKRLLKKVLTKHH